MNSKLIMIAGIAILVIGGGLMLYNYQGSVNNSPDDIVIDGTVNETVTETGQVRLSGTPLVVTNATVAHTDTTAVVVGTVNPNGAFTQYWYEYGTSANFGSKISNQLIGSGYTATPAPGYITGLTKDTTYYF